MAVSYELTTLASVKEFLGITDSSQDDFLDNLIDSITDQIEGMLGGRRIAKETQTDELHDGGEDKVFLKNWPIIQPPTILVERRSGTISNPTFVAFLVDEFVVYEDAGYIQFFGRTPGQHFHNNDARLLATPSLSAGHRNIRVTYDAGFDVIPFDLRLLANQMVASAFNRSSSVGIKKESVEGASVEYFGEQQSSQVHTSILTLEQQLVINKYRRYNVGQNL